MSPYSTESNCMCGVEGFHRVISDMPQPRITSEQSIHESVGKVLGIANAI